MKWPKGPTAWLSPGDNPGGNTMYVSVPFTWNLPSVRETVATRDMFNKWVVIGGPAVKLFPNYFDGIDGVTVSDSWPFVLQRVNSLATRTTTGCPNKCKFCSVPKIEGKFSELKDWPDLPILCDNNILAASQTHLDRVFDRLERHTGVDFNQGLDCNLLNEYHIERLLRLKRPKVRLACDSSGMLQHWTMAYDALRGAGVPKSWIQSYALVGFDSGPTECWDRCEFISRRCKVNPQWYHSLDCMNYNTVTNNQVTLGWTEDTRKGLMAYYYKHRGRPYQEKPAGRLKRENTGQQELGLSIKSISV